MHSPVFRARQASLPLSDKLTLDTYKPMPLAKLETNLVCLT